MMKGTVALWYEPHASSLKETPCLELHVNLWRDLPSRTNFLDLGLELNQVENVKRFYLYVPARIPVDDFMDLSSILRSTLNVVFNDVVRLEEEGDGWYNVDRGLKRKTTVFTLQANDIEVADDEDPVVGIGTRIIFRESLCQRFASTSEPKYLRFRMALAGDSSRAFSSEIVSGDRAFASAAGRLELTEFRLNERRSYPLSISGRQGRGEFNITTIHYFLIRDLEHQLITQHAPFEKVRRLEGNLWAGYLAGLRDASTSRLTARVAERMVIYHWKVKAKIKFQNDAGAEPPNAASIDDFVAFASFRTSTVHPTFYALVIVLLGAAGSAMAAMLAASETLQLATKRWLPATALDAKGMPAVAPMNFVLWIALVVVILTLAYMPLLIDVISRVVRSSYSRTGEALRFRFRNRLKRGP